MVSSSFFKYGTKDDSFLRFFYSSIHGNQVQLNKKSLLYIHGWSANRLQCLNVSNIKCNTKGDAGVFYISAPYCLHILMNTLSNLEGQAIYHLNLQDGQRSYGHYIGYSNFEGNTYTDRGIFFFDLNDGTKISIENCVLKESRSDLFITEKEIKGSTVLVRNCVFSIGQDFGPAKDNSNTVNSNPEFNKLAHYAYSDLCLAKNETDARGCANETCPGEVGCPSWAFNFDPGDYTYSQFHDPDVDGPTPSPTGEFSYSKIFSSSEGFSKSSSFSDSIHFSPSGHFSETEDFSKSQSFTESGIFSFSAGFSHSSSFSESVSFSPTNKFSGSALFSESGDFSKSQSFTESGAFSFSSVFSHSSSFSGSVSFSPTNKFSGSIVFSKSGDFSESSDFSRSQSFSSSKGFSGSKHFSPSTHFSSSEGFTETGKFSESQKFTKSGDFTNSNSFAPTVGFNATKTFTPSSKFTPSSAFSYSDDFTKSISFTNSNRFSESSDFSNSNKFTESSGFNKTNSFTHSTAFSSSDDFTKTGSFSFSKSFTDSGRFTNSGVFTKSGDFTHSSKFSDSYSFSDSNIVTPNQKPVIIDINQEERSTIPVGASVGIGLGVAAVAAAIIVGALFLRRKKVASSDMFEGETINMAEDKTSSVINNVSLMDIMSDDDPFEDEFY